MRIAVPVYEEVFCEHFGRANGFLLCEADEATRQLDRPRFVMRPKSKCESVPHWLKQMGVTTVLAGGIGGVAKHHLAELGITVSAGHTGRDPKDVVAGFLATPNQPRKNPCPDLEHRHHHCRRKRASE